MGKLLTLYKEIEKENGDILEIMTAKMNEEHFSEEKIKILSDKSLRLGKEGNKNE